MPKMKTNKGAAKRFKRTGTGALKRARTNRRHILTKKSQKRKRHLRDCIQIKTADLRSARRLLREE